MDESDTSRAESPREQRWSLRDFDIGKPLGKGHFGKVYLARLKSPTNPFVLVLKCLPKDAVLKEGVTIQVRREIEIMQSLRHPNIIQLYGWFHDDTRIFLMLELAGQGEVYKHLRKAGKFSERRSSSYIRQVADGLAYLHAKDIIHRDIKPENLLLGSEGQIKIADFGWSVRMEADSQRTLAGTLSYVAPEMIMGQPYGKGIDIWALGVLTYEFITGEEPFGTDTSSGTRFTQARICRVDLRIPEYVSAEARDLIHKLLQLVPSERLPLAMIPDQPWIAQHHQ
ncbi:kinase-like domain-containing protein [Dioszegia hungarica]|uniref:Aurora kinase n=1 Tax=Dioszegia hungarica TaxID=4972 RepID=A0AA38LVF4_9TREE|nr:kinase-like domain-containing protein [Dioszegia hungarica]KAI9635176.1 kinase-like domain-containing protein [Dioszegia hungarica]